MDVITQVVGLDVERECFVTGIPCSSSFVGWESDLSTDILAVVIAEILTEAERLKALGLKCKVCIISDHGQQRKIDGLIKSICWAGYNRLGQRCIRKFNLDMDYGAHDIECGALAIKRSVDLLGLAEEDNVVFEGYAGDSGGGLKAQDLGPELERIGVLSCNYIVANCIFHGMNKVIETAGTDALGSFGMNHYNCWQLCFLVTSMISFLKKRVASKL